MNNLLKVALSNDDYTHIRLSLLNGISTTHIYRDRVLDDSEVHYALDVILEEFEFPELDRAIQVFRQENGRLSEEEIKVFTVED